MTANALDRVFLFSERVKFTEKMSTVQIGGVLLNDYKGYKTPHNNLEAGKPNTIYVTHDEHIQIKPLESTLPKFADEKDSPDYIQCFPLCT